MQDFIPLIFLIGLLAISIALINKFKKINRPYLLWLGLALAAVVIFGFWFLPVSFCTEIVDDDISVTLVSESVGPYILTGQKKTQFLTELRATKFRREFFESQGLSGNELYYHAIIQAPGLFFNLDLYVTVDEDVKVLQLKQSKQLFNQPFRAISPSLLAERIVQIMRVQVSQ